MRQDCLEVFVIRSNLFLYSINPFDPKSIKKIYFDISLSSLCIYPVQIVKEMKLSLFDRQTYTVVNLKL